MNKYIPYIVIGSIIALIGAVQVFPSISWQVVTLEEITVRKHKEMNNQQKQIDSDNLRTIEDCHAYSLSKSKYPEKYKSLYLECYEKWRKPDVLKSKYNLYASGSQSK